MPTAYVIQRRVWVCRDSSAPDPRLLFHLRTGDYLATLATYLGVLEDALQECITAQQTPRAEHLALLRRLRTDLSYVHNTHDLRQKTNKHVDTN